MASGKPGRRCSSREPSSTTTASPAASSRDLMAQCFPSVPLAQGLGEFESLQSSATAQRLLGYVPRHSWRQPV